MAFLHSALRPSKSTLGVALSTALSLVLLASPTAPAHASAASDALATCLEQNLSSQDRKVLVQWAYVALSKTSAAKEIQTIPTAKVKAVESQVQKTLTNVVMKRCAKPAGLLLLKDPKNGLQDTLETLAVSLAKAELAKRTTPVLPITITDLLRR